MSQIVDPIEGPVADDAALDDERLTIPRLARHQIQLSDGHEVGIAVAGRGIPLVVIHGFSAEGFLYAQTLSRLVSMGFKVIAVDTAGHGGTQGLPGDGHTLLHYSELLGRILDELGLERYILAGHSMGGRIVTQLGAERPDETVAIVLIDAIVGDTWDKMVYLFRVAPPLLPLIAAGLMLDAATVMPFMANPAQATKLLRLMVPTITGHVLRPWRLLGPMISILRSRSSRYALNRIAEMDVPLVAIHGSWDLPVPIRTAREAAERADGTLVAVANAGHSWILRDPETLPAIMSELMEGPLGEACDDALRDAGVDPDDHTIDEVEAACYRHDAKIFALTPPGAAQAPESRLHRARFRWSTEDHGEAAQN